MRAPRFALLALAVVAAPATPAPPALPEGLAERVARLQAVALASDAGYAVTRSLVVEVGPRLAGSPGDAAAVAWAEAKLRALGFDRVWTEPVTVPVWVRGDAAAEIVGTPPRPLAVAALGGSAGTGGWIEAEVVAVEDTAALEALPDERVRGRIVYVTKRMTRAQDGSGYGPAVRNRGRGPGVASRKGAVAFVMRSVATDDHRFPHTGATRWPEGVTKIPAAALSNPDADLLSARLAMGGPVRLRLDLGCREAGEAASANVLAEMRGASQPDEIVLLGAHLDSWDLGAGAIDDGTGVGVVTAAARLAAGAAGERPARTIRVALFANEELGLSGARAYAERHADEAARHVAAFESDFGTGRVFRFRGRVAAEDAPWLTPLAGLLEPLGVAFDAGEAFGGADTGPLEKLGVPTFDLNHDGTDYFDVHHTADDTLDKVDPAALRQAVAAYATLARALAELPAPLARTPPPAQSF